MTDGRRESDGVSRTRARRVYNTDPKNKTVPALRRGTSAIRTVLPRAANPMTVHVRATCIDDNAGCYAYTIILYHTILLY